MISPLEGEMSVAEGGDARTMKKQRLYLFDTTLRDGQQTPGIDFSVEDKIAIAKLLDDFGMDYVEGGYPGANPTDTEFFSKKRTSSAPASSPSA
jgi:2-isopropylmalate synthase